MNLVIDIGNTKTKYGVFNGSSILDSGYAEGLKLEELLNKFPIENSIICSVAGQEQEIEEKLKQSTKYIEFTAKTPVPIKNLYQTQNTLGSDRLAAAIGAQAQFPNTDTLIIDTGTCIKYNFVNKSGEYHGGGISPGIDMRFKALKNFTHKLPEITADYNFDTLIGNDTQRSILSGVMNGAIQEVKGVIEEYYLQYPAIKIVITGGNHVYFAKRLKSSIFADPFLLLKGLNSIIEFNTSK